MRRQMLCLRHVRLADWGTGDLRDVSFSLYKGEAILLTGLYRSGLATLTKLLAGELGDFSGTICFGQNTCHAVTHETARAEGVAVIGHRSATGSDLSYEEHLQLLTRGRHIFDLLRPPLPSPGTGELAAVMEFDPKEPCTTPFQHVQREILTAYAAGAHIFLFTDMMAYCRADDLIVLERVLHFLKAHGAALLLLTYNDDMLWCYSDTADRCLVMRRGMMSPALYKDDTGVFDLETIHHLIVGRRFLPRTQGATSEPQTGQALFSLRAGGMDLPLVPGRVTGLYDESGRVLTGPDDLFGREISLISAKSGQPIHACTFQDLSLQGVALITNILPEKLIFRNLSPAENASFFAMRRFGRRLVYDPHVAQYLFADTIRRYAVLKHCVELVEHKNCYGLSQQELFELLLAKWLAARPDILIFLAPLTNEDIKMTERLHELRQSLKAQGRAILLISGDYDHLESQCDEIITP